MTCDDDLLKPTKASFQVERICAEEPYFEASESPVKIHQFVHILGYLAMPPILGPERHLHPSTPDRKYQETQEVFRTKNVCPDI
jgi:hypothetical protein